MSRSPFKFLDSYGKEDAATFFGREQETDELYARCTHAQTLVIYGRSGTGKTSLIQCGLRSRFDESDWLPIVIRRGSDLNANLLNELRAAAITPSKSTDALELVHNVYLDHFVPVYLIFDQFEELFIFGDEEEQQTFITTARTLIEKEQHVRLLFIVREEYLAQFTAFEDQVPSILEHRMRVERMPRRRAAEVVEKLCATAGIPVEPGFSAALLDRLSTDGGGVELSYVQVLLDQCWKKREGEEPFGLALLERIGQLDDVLGDLLDEQIGQCSDPRKAEALLKAFVSDQGTKRPLTDPEAEGWMKAMGQPMEAADLQRLLQELVDRRLLTERDESGRHELRHDALAARIFERITKVEKEVADVRSFVTQAHKQFTKRGQRLAQADLDYLRPYKHQLHLSDVEERFVEDAFADERAREDRARKKRRWLVGGLVALLAAVGLFTARTVNALARERRMSESVRLVQRSGELVNSDPQAAYLLAERGYQLDRTLNAERAVMCAYNSLFNEAARFPGTAVLVASDRRTFLSIDPLKSFSLCDTDGKVIFTQALARPPGIGVQYVSAGRYLLNVDSTVHIFDLKGKVLFMCPLLKWHSFNDQGGFTARYGDSLLVENNGTFSRFRLPERLRKDLGPAIATLSEGITSGGLVYLVDRDSLFVWDPASGMVLRSWGHSILMENDNSGTAPWNVQEVDGSIFLLTIAGLERFDLRDGSTNDVLPPAGPGTMQWLMRGILMQFKKEFASAAIWELARPKEGARRFSGHFRRYFSSTGNVLLNDTKDTRGNYSLVDRSGREVLRTSGRLIGTSVDEIQLARDHFVIVSEASVTEDSIRVYRSDGGLSWSTVVPKISPHLYEERPSLTFDEAGDTVTVCYFHNNVINGQSLQECRILRNGRTIFYTTKEPFSFYWDRFIFNVVGKDRLLLSRFRDGFSLIRSGLSSIPLPPRDLYDMVEFSPAGVGYFQEDRKMNKLDIGIWTYRDDTMRHVQLDMRDPELVAALKIGSSGNILFSADGWHIRCYLVNDSLPTGGRDFIWRTSDGGLVDTKWTHGPMSYGQTWEPHGTEHVERNDSLLLLDREMKELIWSAKLNGLEGCFFNAQDRYLSLCGAGGKVRVIDLEKRSTKDILVDTTELDEEVRAALSTGMGMIVVEGSEVIDLVAFGSNNAMILQRVVSGQPRNVLSLKGDVKFNTVRDTTYLTLENKTLRQGIGEYESYANFKRSYYRLDSQKGDLLLTQVPARQVLSEVYQSSGYFIKKEEDVIFQVGKASFIRYDEHRAVSPHRLVDHFELFPKDPTTAIQLVREKKVYGEFWKNIDTKALFKEPE